MEYEFRDGRIFVHRTVEEKARIIDRLKKIEGQVRGVQQMIEDSRYCLDEVQQANAIVAAMRQV
jgi:DNA-binding FrmR family transcriptional regulator